MQTFLINLGNRPDRLFAATQSLNAIGLSFQTVRAIDGKQIDIKQYSRSLLCKVYGKYPNRLSGSVGCFLSHRSVWELIVAHSISFALILEDDATVHKWDERILDINMASLDIDVLGLGIARKVFRKNRESIHEKAKRSTLEWVDRKLIELDVIGGAYLVTLGGAKKLLGCRKYWFPVDHFQTWRAIYDVRSYLLFPPMFVDIESASSMSQSGIATHHRLCHKYINFAKRARGPILKSILLAKGLCRH